MVVPVELSKAMVNLVFSTVQCRWPVKTGMLHWVPFSSHYVHFQVFRVSTWSGIGRELRLVKLFMPEIKGESSSPFLVSLSLIMKEPTLVLGSCRSSSAFSLPSPSNSQLWRMKKQILKFGHQWNRAACGRESAALARKVTAKTTVVIL